MSPGDHGSFHHKSGSIDETGGVHATENYCVLVDVDPVPFSSQKCEVLKSNSLFRINIMSNSVTRGQTVKVRVPGYHL